MDKTVAPPRQPILPEMHALLSNTQTDITIVSGQLCDKIAWQTNNLKANYLGQNGNHAVDINGQELWNTPLTEQEREEIMLHVTELLKKLPEQPDPAYSPIEDRGAQITFSPVGNTAPIELKQNYDPDAKKRLSLLTELPFQSNTLMALIGGSTSIDYIPKTRHKGTNVKKFIEYMDWDPADCVYFGDGLYPGGNDEFVIGVIETIPVNDHLDCYEKLLSL